MAADVLPIINLPAVLGNLPKAANGLPLVPIGNDMQETNTVLKISLYILIHLKIIPWKFRVLNRKNSRVIHP